GPSGYWVGHSGRVLRSGAYLGPGAGPCARPLGISPLRNHPWDKPTQGLLNLWANSLHPVRHRRPHLFPSLTAANDRPPATRIRWQPLLWQGVVSPFREPEAVADKGERRFTGWAAVFLAPHLPSSSTGTDGEVRGRRSRRKSGLIRTGKV